MLSLQPAIESANLARRVGVVLGSLLVTFYYCSKVLLRALVGACGVPTIAIPGAGRPAAAPGAHAPERARADAGLQ